MSRNSAITIPFVGGGGSSSNNYFGYIFSASSYTGQNSFIPESLKTVTVTRRAIPTYAFHDCNNLTSVIIGNNIAQHAFYYCTSLISVTIGSSVTTIEQEAFLHCDNITSVMFEGASTNFYTKTSYTYESFPSAGSLKTAYNAGGIGTYTRTANGTSWTKQL